MNRYVTISLSCAAAALIGLGAASLAAQQPERIGTNTPGAPAPVPTTTTVLGTIRIGKAVKADGQPLAPGTYTMRVTEREATPAAAGQTPQFERWAEFLQGNQVKGREVVTIVPPDAARQVMKERFPPNNGYRADVLKGGDYYRIWYNKGGTHYLVHFNI